MSAEDLDRFEDEGGFHDEEEENLSGDRKPRNPRKPRWPTELEIELEEEEEILELMGVNK